MSDETRIKQLRIGRKVSQGQLARRLGIHRTYIAKIESGQRKPGRDLLFKLAQYFECPAQELIEYKKDSK